MSADNSKYIIRHSQRADIAEMQEVFAEAKQKMRESGNVLQWTGAYPTDEQLMSDIDRGFSYVVEEDGKIIATFVLAICVDPTYLNIYNGAWLDDELPYGTIHRIASRHGTRGIARMVIDWCNDRISNLRVDTHRDNMPMQHIMQSNGFTYCGIIYLLNGDERLAYQRIK